MVCHSQQEAGIVQQWLQRRRQAGIMLMSASPVGFAKQAKKHAWASL
jgi:hypothetical protein